MIKTGIHPDDESRIRRFLEQIDRASISHQPVSLMDVGAFQSRWVQGVLRPQSVSEVNHIVHSANQTGVHLHPYSTGMNWGFGSRSPVISGGFLLDMGDMNKIRSLDLVSGQAEIEPGVDQQSLANALEGSKWMLNVTSAGASTGIIGNALENGVGSYRHRTHDLLGLQAILGNGTSVIVQQQDPATDDSLDPADFIQSNFGIVTSATISLLPRPEHVAILSLHFPTNETYKTIDSFRQLMKEGLIAGVPKMFNREDGQSQLIAALQGNQRELQQKTDAVQKALGWSPTIYFSWQPPHDDLIQSQFEIFSGIPTNRALKRFIMTPGKKLDPDTHSYLGFKLLALAVPLQARLIEWCVEKLNTHYEESTSLEYTWNLWSPDMLGLVVYILFARNAAGQQAASMLHDTLYERFAQEGIFPYRYDIDHMDRFQQDHPKAYKRRQRLKNTYDPLQIIAPGKYV